MKHSLSVLILILIMACASCTDKKKSDASTTTSGKDCPPIDTLSVIGNIDLETASNLISAFLKEPKLGDMGRKYAIGGTFPKDEFYQLNSNATEQEGPLLWFCYNEQDIKRKLFLSVEKRNSVTAAAYPSGPLAADLSYPTHIFRYDGAGNEPKDVEAYLKKQKSVGQASRRITSGDVHTLAGAFASGFGKGYCRYAFSFFNNGEIEVQRQTEKQGLAKFLNQPGLDQVRYYFGYDPTHAADNQIRVILFGVNASGYNMCQYTYPLVGECITRSPPIILQKSIPPQ